VPGVSGLSVRSFVEVDQHYGQLLLRNSLGLGMDLRFQRQHGPFGDEGVDIPGNCRVFSWSRISTT
jgi:hypothetical protein